MLGGLLVIWYVIGAVQTVNPFVGLPSLLPLSMRLFGFFRLLAFFTPLAHGHQSTFDNLILNPLREDVIKYTWLRERYSCDGVQQPNRTQYYFEFPAFVAIAEREVRYGVFMCLNIREGLRIYEQWGGKTIAMNHTPIESSSNSTIVSLPPIFRCTRAPMIRHQSGSAHSDYISIWPV